MLKTSGISLTSVAALLSSCAAGSVMEASPATTALASPARSLTCPTATLANGDAALRDDFRAAMSEACAVLESQAFRQTIEGLNLARKCPRAFGKHRLIAGAEIYRRLAAGMPESFTVTAEPLSGS